ncbi:MAG: hypothetical protein J5938_06470 [Clostridia bacterium]|nr:hypothetical protein [Clostridia bacterium]
MRILELLGLTSNEFWGSVLILLGIAGLVFAYVHWRVTESWKKEKGEKTRLLEIWKPSLLFGCALFFLLGIGFWLIGLWIHF